MTSETRISPAIPVTIIGGYLGAGKTATINHLLRHNDGKRLAVLVNDFGAINIDAELIASADGETVALQNGCVCCSIADDLAQTLKDIVDWDDAPDHIVIEASGAADPGKIARYPRGWPGLRLAGTVVLVDCETVAQKRQDKFVGRLIRQQIAGADFLILNKQDQLREGDIDAVRNVVAMDAGTDRLVETSQGAVNAHDVLQDLIDPDRPHDPAGKDLPVDIFDSVSLCFDAPFDRTNLERVLADLPDAIARIKGFVRLTSEPAANHLLQYVAGRWTLDLQERQTPSQTSELVIIAPKGQLNRDLLQSQLVAATR